MKTLAQHIKDDQIIEGVIKSELNRGRSVYLVQVNGTDQTAVTSQPKLWGGEKAEDGIGLIALEGEAGFKATFSEPIDQIDTIDQM